MNLISILQKNTAQALSDIYGAVVEPAAIQLYETKKEFEGDYTVVVFPFTRFSKKTPEITSSTLGEYLQKNIFLPEEIQNSGETKTSVYGSLPLITGFNVIKGFLNLSIADFYWIAFLNHASVTDFGFQKPCSGTTMMVEYSSPNTNKPLHLGHIRNNLLGYAVAQIAGAAGHNVIKANLINDRGVHICKSMLAWQKWGNAETPESSGMKGDYLVGKYYVLFDRELKKQETSQKTEEQKILFHEKDLGGEVQEMLRKWEAGDKETIALWKMMNGWVYKGFEETYKKLGVDFDKFYYESETYLLGKTIVEEGLQKGIFYKKEDGSVWIDLTGDGLDNKLLLRHDGTSVYITQDLGTAQIRYDEYPLDKLVYVVGNEQDYHFKVLKLILKKLRRKFADDIYHLSYGMVDLPSGKMKSREGTVVDADVLIAEMLETARKKTKELGKTDGFSDEEAEKLYSIIGMGALKYFILKIDPQKRMMFNPEESIDFNGNTGPFIQYTYARIQSVIRKAEQHSEIQIQQVASEINLHPKEKEVLKTIEQFPRIIQEASDTFSPAVIANYVYELAKTYNQFYHELPILYEEDTSLSVFRLNLSKTTGTVIKKSLFLLGIDVPERM